MYGIGGIALRSNLFFGLFKSKKKKTVALRILLIEDNALDRVFIENVLRKAYFEVVTAENGRDGVELAMQNNWDLVILDYFLPDANGTEICRMLRENAGTKNIPVVFLTVAQDGYTLLECYEAGAHLFLNKPINAGELIGQVRLALKNKQEELENDDQFF